MATYITGAAQILSIWNSTGGDGTGAYEPIACLQSNGFSSERDTTDIEIPLTKCDYNSSTGSFTAILGNKEVSLGAKTETASFEGIATETEAGKNTYIQLKTLFDAGTLKTYKLSNVDKDNSGSAPTSVDLYFNGYITSLELTSPNEERSTFSGEIIVNKEGSSTTEPTTKY